MGSLMAILVIAGIVWFWAHSLWIRERVLRHCARTCKQMNVQLLDQTVALSRLALDRDPQGRLSLRRWYVFEFSTDGGDRCKGCVGLLGSRIECVRMEYPGGPIIMGS
jgi:hypothetical protein